MGWKDAPLVADAGGGWQAAPLADAPPAPKGNDVTGTRPGFVETVAPYMDPRGIPEAALAMGSGMAGQAIGGLAGLAGAALPGEAGQGARVAERVSNALTYEPKTKSGQTLMKGAELLSAPVHWAAEKAGEQGEKIGPGAATAAKTLVEGIPLALGARAAVTPAKPLTSKQQKVADARDAGFKMTPEEMDAGIIPRQLASISGEPRLAKINSRENAALGTDKAKAELGIRPDAPLDLETLGHIRKDAGKAYDEARGIGQVAMDTQYLADLDALAAKYKSAASEFKGADKVLQLAEIEDTLAMLRKQDPAIQAAQAQGIKIPQSAIAPSTFEASGAIDMIGALRESADAAFRGGKPALGKVMRGGADALESNIQRHLEGWKPDQAVQNAPSAQVLDNFRAARERIAKTYAIEKALVGDQVNPQALGRQVAKRKPLTGGLKETGEFAREFDRSSQKPTNMPTGASFADLGLAALNGLRSSGGSLVLDALSVGARPALRHILSSRLSQAAMDPRTNLSGPALEAVGASSSLPPPQEKRR